MAGNKNKKSKVLIVLSYILASALIIAGIVLVAVYYPNFEQYEKAIYYFNLQTNGAVDFSQYPLSSYNTNAASNSWPIASVGEFAAGITMLLLGLIIMIITIVINLKVKKNQPKIHKIKKIKK